MATIAWLKTPIGMPDFPRHQMVANCFAALRPPDGLWKAYLAEIDKLQAQGAISTEDYGLLRFSTQARSALMDLTFGNIEGFASGTVAEVLEVAKAAARAETEAALRDESSKRAAAEMAAELEKDKADLRREAQLSQVRGIASSIVRWASALTLGAGHILVILGTYLTLPQPFPPLPGGWWALAAPGLLAALGLLSIANLVFGTTIQALVRRFDSYVSGKVERLLRILVDV